MMDNKDRIEHAMRESMHSDESRQDLEDLPAGKLTVDAVQLRAQQRFLTYLASQTPTPELGTGQGKTFNAMSGQSFHASCKTGYHCPVATGG